MEFLARLLWVARVLVQGERNVVVLRHSQTGAVFTDGSSAQAAVRFDSASQASAFSVRFLDEGLAWTAVTDEHFCRAA